MIGKKQSSKKQMSRVRAFWDNRAVQKNFSTDSVTHTDIWQRWLEIEMMGSYLKKTDRVLDVGCGNGYSTKLFAPLVKEIVGIDYSDAMIERAKTEAFNNVAKGKKPPQFHQCDVRSLNPTLYGQFDVAISERCLINLASFEEQKKALLNIHSVLKRGGRYILVEGGADGRKMLDKTRETVGLSKMPRVWHNIDFPENKTLKFLEKHYKVEERRHFGMYDFISRVVHPLLVLPEQPKYDAKINEVAARLALHSEEFGDISRVLFLVLKKK